MAPPPAPDDAPKFSLERNALVTVQGPTPSAGCFLSAGGLMVTTHAAALDALAAAGKLEAGVSDEEVPCEGCEVWVARAREDCSAEVLRRAAIRPVKKKFKPKLGPIFAPFN